jgi:hypothetical protein
MIDKLLLKDQRARPGIQEILESETMKEKMKLYGYSMPTAEELMLPANRE